MIASITVNDVVIIETSHRDGRHFPEKFKAVLKNFVVS